VLEKSHSGHGRGFLWPGGQRDALPSMGIFFAQFGALEREEGAAGSHLNAALTLRRSTSHHAAPARCLLPHRGAGLGPKAASGSSASPGGNPNPQMEA